MDRSSRERNASCLLPLVYVAIITTYCNRFVTKYQPTAHQRTAVQQQGTVPFVKSSDGLVDDKNPNRPECNPGLQQTTRTTDILLTSRLHASEVFTWVSWSVGEAMLIQELTNNATNNLVCCQPSALYFTTPSCISHAPIEPQVSVSDQRP